MACIAIALYDCEADEGNELSFEEGDRIKVVSKEWNGDSAWWYGELDGEEGCFPSNYVEVDASAPPPVAPRRRKQSAMGTAMFRTSLTGKIAPVSSTTKKKKKVYESRGTARSGKEWASTSSAAANGAYGLDAALEAKKAASYDGTAETRAALWIEELSGKRYTGDFAGWLKDGTVLVKAMNALGKRVGGVAKIKANKSSMPFKQMENISAFLSGCRQLGMREQEVFCTPDLFEEKNIMLVVNAILALKKRVEGGGGPAPSAANRPATAATYGSRKPQAKAKFGTGGGVSKLNMGSRGIMQKTEGAYGDITRGHDAGNSGLGQTTKKKKKKAPLVAAPSGGVYESRGQGADGKVWASTSSAASNGSYGLDAALEAKKAAAYDHGAEARAALWLEEVSGKRYTGDFAEWLKDGTVLVSAMNKLGKARGVKKIKANKSSMPFKQMENISNFLSGCRQVRPRPPRYTARPLSVALSVSCFYSFVCVYLLFARLRPYLSPRQCASELDSTECPAHSPARRFFRTTTPLSRSTPRPRSLPRSLARSPARYARVGGLLHS
jgi:hypothetical protein